MKLYFALLAVISLSLAGLHTSTKTQPPSIRAFEEPLVTIGTASVDENNALIIALHTYQKRKSYEDVSALTTFLSSYPQSPWKFSLLANLGIVYRKTGYFSKAIDAWEQAWVLGKGEKDVKVQALANRVVSELAMLLSSLGRTERLDSLLKEIKGRPLYGSANAVLLTIKENLWLMKNRPGDSFKCGAFALDSIQTFANKKNAHDRLVEKAQSSPKGFSLTQVRDLSNSLKMNYQMAKRQPGAAFIIPSVVHWKSGHYAALLKKQGNFYLTKDPTFGQSLLVTSQALEDESSGYCLVPNGTLPSGWTTVSDAEGKTVWGRGLVPSRVIAATKPKDKKPCPGGGNGMAVYSLFAMLVSLSIQDTPVGYTPPVGPDLHFTITYNQYEGTQPSTFSFFNFGPCWNCAWLSYVTAPTSLGGTAYVNIRGGGQETYDASTYTNTGSTYSGYHGYYGNELQSQATLWVGTSGTYERRLPDGSKEVFGPTNSGGFFFLTGIIDPQGNTVTLSYDTSFRLTSVTDALGLSTTLYYGLSPSTPDPTNPLTYLVTQVKDPYLRSAYFGYTSYSGTYQLTCIKDVLGIKSQFTYGTGSAITQMVTPYGTTTFTASTGDNTVPVRTLNVTEPDGSEVYAESHIDGSNYPYTSGGSSLTTEPVPSASTFIVGYSSEYLMYRNTFYWDKKAMEVTGDNPTSDYTKAYIYHFLHSQSNQESPVLESEKPAAENRIWYNQNYYPTYSWYTGEIITGTTDKPIAKARVTSGGTQVTQYQYSNSSNPGLVTAIIDPLGRKTNYTYASNGIDLTQVSQTTASGSDVLSATTYNSQHSPLTVTDAAGETTTYTYNSQNQILTITPPTRSGHSAETTSYAYTGNYLTSITGPMTGAVTALTYDTLNSLTVNRVKTVADPESYAAGSGAYTRSYTYDNLDRVTQIEYPDSTTETFSYLNPTTGHIDLDIHSLTDRLGRTTTRTYDSTRHLTSVTDPLSRTTQYGWCSCGSMISLTDPSGNVTHFNRDVESRLTSKVYPDSSQVSYTYDTVGRLSTTTDARGNVGTTTYNLDNTVSGITYSLASGTAAPPTLSYGYDTYYNRLTSAGGVTLTYYAAGGLGGGQVETVANTLTGGSATITYTYDEWGRKVGSNIDSSNPQSVVFDSLGRVTNALNLLAPTTPGFAYSYFDPTHPTSRIGSVTYPSGQSTVYNYLGYMADERLSEIKNLTPASAVLSQNDYTYDAVGKILTWQQQTDSNTPLLWTDGYDAADQLTSAVQTNTAITSPAVLSNSYTYDSLGNPTSQVSAGVTRSGSYNSLNQLTGSTPSGSPTVQLTGALNGAATVTVNGTTAIVNSGHYFSGTAGVTAGATNTVDVVATDGSGNQRTNHYQIVTPAQPTYSPSYDADGNETSDGAGLTFTWDARNELASITYSTGPDAGNHTEFTYDALGHRIAIVERTGTTIGSGTVTSTKQLVWDGDTIAEERSASNSVTKRFYYQGEQISGISYYYTRDHLGSVWEMTDDSGNVQARYDYDPYGRTTYVQGTLASDFQYAGYYEHPNSDLNLTSHRVYDPIAARWLSRDPLKKAEIKEGPDLYEYVKNNPINATDPNGLGTWTFDTTNLSAQLGSTTIDAFYTMDADECKCCSSAVVDRKVDSGSGGAESGGGGNPGDWLSDDSPGYGGYSVGNQAHAEADNPQGPGIGWPINYRFPSSNVFQWKARCTSGPWSGKILSTTTKTVSTSGHSVGSNYTITVQ
jgi:RHS repeat-associated protein